MGIRSVRAFSVLVLFLGPTLFSGGKGDSSFDAGYCHYFGH